MDQPIIDFSVNEGSSTERNNAIQKDFLEISDQIKKNPETINRIKDKTLKNLDTYLSTNKDQAKQMLLDISDAMQKNTNLQKKDANSLMELQKLCIAKTTWEEVGTYQLHKDVLNPTFDLAKLTTYGSLFQTGNTNNWFANITETYIQGANPKFDQLFTTGEFKSVYFSPAQLQKELYKKNTERRNTLVASMKALTPENLTKLMADAKLSTIEDISGNSPESTKVIKATFPTIADPYREFKQILVKDPSIMTEWKAKMPEAKRTEVEASNDQTPVAKTEVIPATTETATTGFTKESVINNISDEKLQSWYTKEGSINKTEDIIRLIQENITDNEIIKGKKVELSNLLKDGKLTDFQQKVGIQDNQKWNDGSSRLDGKLGPYTLQKTNEYLEVKQVGSENADLNTITETNNPSATSTTETTRVTAEKQKTEAKNIGNIEYTFKEKGNEMIISSTVNGLISNVKLRFDNTGKMNGYRFDNTTGFVPIKYDLHKEEIKGKGIISLNSADTKKISGSDIIVMDSNWNIMKGNINKGELIDGKLIDADNKTFEFYNGFCLPSQLKNNNTIKQNQLQKRNSLLKKSFAEKGTDTVAEIIENNGKLKIISHGYSVDISDYNLKNLKINDLPLSNTKELILVKNLCNFAAKFKKEVKANPVPFKEFILNKSNISFIRTNFVSGVDFLSSDKMKSIYGITSNDNKNQLIGVLNKAVGVS